MRKTLALLLFMVLLCGACLPAEANGISSGMLAQDYDAYGMVIGGSLMLRAQPGGDARVLKSYQAGSWLRIIGGRTEGDYYYVATEDGKSGYMLAQYIAYADNYAMNQGEFSATPATVQGQAKYVNLRAAPNTNAAVITRLYNGTRVNVVSYGEVFSHVTTQDGQYAGYMSSGLLRMDGQTVWEEGLILSPNRGKVNLRGGPVLTAPVLGSYVSGTPVTVLMRGIGWLKVFVGGKMGYIMSGYVQNKVK